MPNRLVTGGLLRKPLERVLTRGWQRRGWLALVLWPLSLVYGLLFKLRSAIGQSAALPPGAGRAKVIVVGNVIAGGSGKTPVVMALVRHLQARGLTSGVISRGYGRSTTGCREVQLSDLAEASGDEPALIKQATGVPVFVAARRQEAAAALMQCHPATRLIISDDGLQHQGLHRDLEICVFDDRGLGNGLLLPAGPLREPWPRSADLVLHTGNSPAFAGHRARRRLSGQACQADGRLVDLKTLFAKRERPLVAIAGIAKPQGFFDMLHQQGLRPDTTLALPDHYNYDSKIVSEYEGYDLICTEKDAIKLWRHNPRALAVPLILEFDAAFLSAFDAHIDRLLGRPVSFEHGHTTS